MVMHTVKITGYLLTGASVVVGQADHLRGSVRCRFVVGCTRER